VRAKAAGKSAEEVAKAWKIPAKYAGYATPTPVRLLQNVQVVFDELEVGPMERTGRRARSA
jgi:hypothetical protein